MYASDLSLADIFEFDASAAFDINSLTLSETVDVSGNIGSPVGLAWNGDGTKLYISNFGDSIVVSYNLTTAFDITSTTFNQSVSLSGGEIWGLMWSDDGSKLFGGSINSEVSVYNANTPFDLSTLTESTPFSRPEFGTVRGIAFSRAAHYNYD